MPEKLDVFFKRNEVCLSQFKAELIGKTVEQENDDGIVYITNKRLFFKGKKSLALSISKILAYESSFDKLIIQLENGNVITFNTKNLLASSVKDHIISLADAQTVSPLQESPGWKAPEQQNAFGLEEQAVTKHHHVKLSKRKSRKQKLAADIMFSLLFLSIIALSYWFFCK
jgi:hypothetical protein